MANVSLKIFRRNIDILCSKSIHAGNYAIYPAVLQEEKCKIGICALSERKKSRFRAFPDASI